MPSEPKSLFCRTSTAASSGPTRLSSASCGSMKNFNASAAVTVVYNKVFSFSTFSSTPLPNVS
jgi:hypothetical protein